MSESDDLFARRISAPTGAVLVGIQASRTRSRLDTEEKRVAAWKAFEASRGPAEIELRTAVRLAFRRQERIMLTKLKELTGE